MTPAFTSPTLVAIKKFKTAPTYTHCIQGVFFYKWKEEAEAGNTVKRGAGKGVTLTNCKNRKGFGIVSGKPQDRATQR